MGFRSGLRINTHQQLWLSKRCLRQLSTQGCWTKPNGSLPCNRTEDAMRLLAWAEDGHINVPYCRTWWQAVEAEEGAHTKHHLSTRAGWPCRATGLGEQGPGQLPRITTRPPWMPIPAMRHRGWRGGKRPFVFFLVFFKGFWVLLLLISLKSQIFGHVPWLTEK